MVNTIWNGYNRKNFFLHGHVGWIVEPSIKSQYGKPWVWRAEFFGGFDYADRELLKQGFYIAYYKVSDMYGCPESIQLMKLFYNFVTYTYGLNKKCDMFGFSRGGLYAVNYTAEFADDINVLYLDAPVLNILSWPGKFFKTKPYRGVHRETEWSECKKCYELKSDEQAFEFKHNPLDKMDTLIKNKIPLVLIMGNDDKIVDYTENGLKLSEFYKKNNGDILMIIKNGAGHHPHSLKNPTPIVNFIINHHKSS